MTNTMQSLSALPTGMRGMFSLIKSTNLMLSLENSHLPVNSIICLPVLV